MKLSPVTIAVLKNFSTINPSIHIQPGNRLVGIEQTERTVIGIAEVPDEFPTDIKIYNLTELINILTMFKDPSLDFGPKQLTIKEGNQVVRYTYAALNKIPSFDKSRPHPKPVLSFDLRADQLANLTKSATLLGLPHIVIEGNGKKITMTATKRDDASSNKYVLDVGDTSHTFKCYYLIENFKQIVRDYRVSMCENCVSSYEATDDKEPTSLKYFIMAQEGSISA
jgi:hypothetical protein